MKLLVDNKIPFFGEYLKKIKNHDQLIIKYFDDNNFENDDCLNADALFIRSTTRVNSELLSNSPIKFIGKLNISIPCSNNCWEVINTYMRTKKF